MAHLIPLECCELESLTWGDHHIEIHLRTSSPQATCPSCQIVSSHVHSRYGRTIGDLPWADYSVSLRVQTRRFFCRVSTCPQRIFTERFGDAVAPSARRTTRLTQWLQTLVMQATAQGMARAVPGCAVPISARTFVRLMHAVPDPIVNPPTVVGLDDWAWKKGRTYGTICVDLERHRPIDLLPDRDPATIAAWLQRHPSITTVARDRGHEFIEGITHGAPAAIQVADRWHLLKNLGEALEAFFLDQRAALQAAAQALNAAPQDSAPGRPLPTIEGTATPTRAQAAQTHWHSEASTRYYTIHGMAAQRVSVAAIARTVGISRPTVYRYLHMIEPPRYAQIQRTRRSVLDPVKPFVAQRWNEGCRNARQLWQELQDQGSTLSLRTVNRFVAALRQESDLRPRTFRQQPAAHHYAKNTTQRRPLTALQAMRLLMTDPDQRKPWQQDYLCYLTLQEPRVAEADELVQAFRCMARTLNGGQLDRWIARAQASSIEPLRTFAKGLLKDYAAVKAGLTLPWSNGQTEAQVQRLKLLKRQMYGQAGLELLRTRVLYRGTRID